MRAENALAQPAFVVDSAVYYPSGAVAIRDIASIRMDAGGCIDLPAGFTEQNAELKSAPVSSLELTGGFHLSR